MKTNAEYKQDERERKRKSGMKRLSDIWVYPCDEPKIKDYIWMITNETKITKNNA